MALAEVIMPRRRLGPLWSAELRREIFARRLIAAAALDVGHDLDGIAAVLAWPAPEIAALLARTDDPYAPSPHLCMTNPALWAEVVGLARASIPHQ